MSEAQPFTVRFTFSPDLVFFLRSADRAQPLTRVLREKTSIKDAIEACGVPHPEVNVIRCDGVHVAFEHQLTASTNVGVSGLESAPKPELQQRQLSQFVADGHLGKLARDMRLLGFDVSYDPHAADHALATISSQENRALLTRDRRLLMHKVVRHGYCPRSHHPDEQVAEVIRRFQLAELIAPYTRCLRCNGLLRRADKDEVLSQLEPLTRFHYNEFRRCQSCQRIYWAGSHFARLASRIKKIRARFNPR